MFGNLFSFYCYFCISIAILAVYDLQMITASGYGDENVISDNNNVISKSPISLKKIHFRLIDIVPNDHLHLHGPQHNNHNNHYKTKESMPMKNGTPTASMATTTTTATATTSPIIEKRRIDAADLRQQISTLTGKILNSINYRANIEQQQQNDAEPRTHILAFECNKTLAMIELRTGTEKRNDTKQKWFESIRVVECAIFDMLKRGDEARRFVKLFETSETAAANNGIASDSNNNNYTFVHYDNVNFRTVMDANQLCRLAWKQQQQQQRDNNNHDNRFWPSILSTRATFFSSLFNGIVDDGIMRAPGTLWCGPGDKAATYWSLGSEAEVDSCCREHDHCPIRLKNGEVNYGQRNEHSFTMSLCECDRHFKHCLADCDGSYGGQIAWIYFRFVHDCLESIDCPSNSSVARNGNREKRTSKVDKSEMGCGGVERFSVGDNDFD